MSRRVWVGGWGGLTMVMMLRVAHTLAHSTPPPHTHAARSLSHRHALVAADVAHALPLADHAVLVRGRKRADAERVERGVRVFSMVMHCSDHAAGVVEHAPVVGAHVRLFQHKALEGGELCGDFFACACVCWTTAAAAPPRTLPTQQPLPPSASYARKAMHVDDARGKGGAALQKTHQLLTGGAARNTGRPPRGRCPPAAAAARPARELGGPQ